MGRASGRRWAGQRRIEPVMFVSSSFFRLLTNRKSSLGEENVLAARVSAIRNLSLFSLLQHVLLLLIQAFPVFTLARRTPPHSPPPTNTCTHSFLSYFKPSHFDFPPFHSSPPDFSPNLALSFSTRLLPSFLTIVPLLCPALALSVVSIYGQSAQADRHRHRFPGFKVEWSLGGFVRQTYSIRVCLRKERTVLNQSHVDETTAGKVHDETKQHDYLSH